VARSTEAWFRILRALEGNPRRVDQAASLLSRLASGSLLVLVSVTWTLWSSGKVPQVPFVGWAAKMPASLEGAALQAFGLSAVIASICGKRSQWGRWSWAVLTLAMGFLVLADQQRLQPWVYQLVVLGIVLVTLPAAEAIALARMLIASLYCFSALSKLDRSFLDSGGGQIVDGLLTCLRLDGHVGASGRVALAGTFGAGELLLALGLCWRRPRKWAWPASIGMHALLIIALGPCGADNKPGVLIWNVYFILQNVILFGLAGELPPADAPAAGATRQSEPFGPLRWLVCGFAAFVILFPLTRPFGLCDVWPAWAVYATSPERLRMFIDAADREKLAPADRKYVQAPRFEDGLCLVRIDRLSLDGCGAPIYPQNRYRLGIVLGIADSAKLGDNIVVELDNAANRLTGERTTRRLTGRSAIASELGRYWLNGFPRENSIPNPPKPVDSR
jgi:hypothetical protein